MERRFRVMDSLANGRRIKCLTVVDDFSRDCVDIAVDYGMGGEYVTKVLDRVAQFRGYPRAIRTDQGPEFTSRAFIVWTHARGIRHLMVRRDSQKEHLEKAMCGRRFQLYRIPDDVQLKRCPQRRHLNLPSESKYGRAVWQLGHFFIAEPV